jgi:hypothetical protein
MPLSVSFARRKHKVVDAVCKKAGSNNQPSLALNPQRCILLRAVLKGQFRATFRPMTGYFMEAVNAGCVNLR